MWPPIILRKEVVYRFLIAFKKVWIYPFGLYITEPFFLQDKIGKEWHNEKALM
jgi:hypothetical protein